MKFIVSWNISEDGRTAASRREDARALARHERGRRIDRRNG
jgi:hypothetical protein